MKVRFVGETSERSLKSKMKLVASAAKLSHFSGNLTQLMKASKGYEDDLKTIKRITRSGHKSVMEHHYINLELSEVTPIIEQILIGFRLTSFTIKSRRYVDFRNVGFYVPTFRRTDGTIHPANEFLKRKYKRHMNRLFRFYSQMVDGGVIKEDARFILPYSFYSEIAMSINAREFEIITEYLLYSEVATIQEVHDLGEAFLEIARQYVPEVVEYIETFHARNSDFDYRSVLATYSNHAKILDHPVLLSYTKDPDDVVIKTGVMAEMQCNYDSAERIIHDIEIEDPAFKAKYMDAIIRKTANRELEQVNFTWQIPISLSILTHLTRHRMHPLMVPNFVPLWNFEHYIIPESVQKSEFAEMYHEMVKKNQEMMQVFKEAEVKEEDLVYFYLGCQMCNVITTTNGRELVWLSRLRTCRRAQWQIQDIVNFMMGETEKVAPLLRKGMGATCRVYHYCPEGKLSCGLIKEILEEEK